MPIQFQHTAARRRLAMGQPSRPIRFNVSTHSRPKAAGQHHGVIGIVLAVSTHSRPKAAGFAGKNPRTRRHGFNTQPPEGGWSVIFGLCNTILLFQHTAARRRLDTDFGTRVSIKPVSTHSRPKAAGYQVGNSCHQTRVSTHSRPKAAGAGCYQTCVLHLVSTHSRPKAAGLLCLTNYTNLLFQHTAARRRLAIVSGYRYCWSSRFNTQPPEGGWASSPAAALEATLFQHTAARRRLDPCHRRHRTQPQFQHTAARRRLDQHQTCNSRLCLFQHTAARRRLAVPMAAIAAVTYGFNTQPPEGGWEGLQQVVQATAVSTHSRPKAAGTDTGRLAEQSRVSTHSRPKAAGLVNLAIFDDTAVSTHSRPKAAGHQSAPSIPPTLRFNTQPPEGGWVPCP